MRTAGTENNMANITLKAVDIRRSATVPTMVCYYHYHPKIIIHTNYLFRSEHLTRIDAHGNESSRNNKKNKQVNG